MYFKFEKGRGSINEIVTYVPGIVYAVLNVAV